MPAKSCRVKAALTVCDLWYLSRKRDIRALTERTEALWFEVEFEVEQMEQAERDGEAGEAARHLDRILYHLSRIQREVRTMCV